MMQLTSVRDRVEQGFAMAVGRRKIWPVLRPESDPIPLDLSPLDVMSDLDPGMIDWEQEPGSPVA